jgi:hypothetical protein
MLYRKFHLQVGDKDRPKAYSQICEMLQHPKFPQAIQVRIAYSREVESQSNEVQRRVMKDFFFELIEGKIRFDSKLLRNIADIFFEFYLVFNKKKTLNFYLGKEINHMLADFKSLGQQFNRDTLICSYIARLRNATYLAAQY